MSADVWDDWVSCWRGKIQLMVLFEAASTSFGAKWLNFPLLIFSVYLHLWPLTAARAGMWYTAGVWTTGRKTLTLIPEDNYFNSGLISSHWLCSSLNSGACSCPTKSVHKTRKRAAGGSALCWDRSRLPRPVPVIKTTQTGSFSLRANFMLTS